VKEEELDLEVYDEDEENANKPSKFSIWWDSFSEGMDRCCKACCCKGWYNLSDALRVQIKERPYLEAIVVILILLNSVSMASEHHG
jgi:hypothetical protein